MKIREVLNALKVIAPLELAEDYNAKNGIQIEGPNVEVKRVLACLDVKPMAIKVAVQSSCRLVVPHHQPIVALVGTIMSSEWYGKSGKAERDHVLRQFCKAGQEYAQSFYVENRRIWKKGDSEGCSWNRQRIGIDSVCVEK